MTAPLPPICSPCQEERSRWLDTRPSQMLPRFGIAHGSGTAHDTSVAGIGDNRRAQYEQWRQLVRTQRDLIARTCREQHHTAAVMALDDHRPGVERKPLLLDLFCGAGGAAMGYHRAGFEVVGVDSQPQPNYPFEFHQADAMTFPLDGFDAYAASPPCTGHTTMASVGGFRGSHGTEWMLQATAERLAATGKPYVVENVAGADMPGALTLCGSEFDLVDGPYMLRRHRQFVSNIFLMGAGGCTCSGRRVIGVYGDLSKNDRKASSRTCADGRPYGDMRAGVGRARRILGCPWMEPHELTQAIPPAYTQFIGEQILAHLGAGQVAA